MIRNVSGFEGGLCTLLSRTGSPSTVVLRRSPVGRSRRWGLSKAVGKCQVQRTGWLSPSGTTRRPGVVVMEFRPSYGGPLLAVPSLRLPYSK